MNISMHGIIGNVQFKWDVHKNEFDHFFDPLPEDWHDLREYAGAVFFGNFKLEFIKTEDDHYCNLFQYGAEDEPGRAYAYLEDDTPYEERYVLSDNIRIRPADSFTAFAEDIEQQIIHLLDRFPKYLPDALVLTDPNKWYPCDHPYHIDEITREA